MKKKILHMGKRERSTSEGGEGPWGNMPPSDNVLRGGGKLSGKAGSGEATLGGNERWPNVVPD